MKTRVCQDCGAESTLFFGFASGCRYNGGSHRTIVESESTEASERAKLRAAYSCCMGYDRANFQKHAPQWMKELLA